MQRHIFSKQFEPIGMEWGWFVRRRFEIAEEDLLDEDLDTLASLIDSCHTGNIEELTATVSQIVSQIDIVIEKFELARVNLPVKKGKKSSKSARGINSIAELANSLTEFKNNLSNLTAVEIMSRGMEIELSQKIKDNFQVASFSQLACKEKLPIVIEIENIGKFKISDGKLSIALDETWRENVLPFSRLIYIEISNILET